MKNKSYFILFISIFFHFFVYGQEFKEYFNTGIAGQANNKSKPYLTPGNRTYIVGTQDGNFPDLGSHVKGEMGGIWMPPIKLLDGFWVKLTDTASNKETWLRQASKFINYPYGNKFVYDSALNGIQVERVQYCPQSKGGIVIMYRAPLKTLYFSLIFCCDFFL